MGKAKKKSKSAARGNDSSRGVAPIDFEASRKNNPPLRFVCLFPDNMINESRPTPRARHIEIQHFAIQEWCKQGDIVMEHLPGIINPSDGLTKALGWVLLSRHARRGMGHYRLGSTVSASRC